MSKKVREAEPSIRKMGGLARQTSEETVGEDDDASSMSGSSAPIVIDAAVCLTAFDAGMEKLSSKKRAEREEGLVSMSTALRAGALVDSLTGR